MLLKKQKILSAFVLLFILLTSCNTTKYLPAGEDLYVGSTIKVESKDRIKDKKKIKEWMKTKLKSLGSMLTWLASKAAEALPV